MQVPLQISYRHTESTEALDALIREKAAELEQFSPRITGCHVFVERPGRHHVQGKGAHFRVRIEVTVPGEVLVVSRDPERHRSHEDAFLSTSEAFHEMRRQLQDYARRKRGDVKVTTHLPHARVASLFPNEGYGFLETADGREIYFHRSSVLGRGFEQLSVGDEVRFSEEPGEKGPQASSVHVLGEGGHHELPAP